MKTARLEDLKMKICSAASEEMLIIIWPKSQRKHCEDAWGPLVEEKKEEGILGNMGHYVQFTYSTGASKRWMS